MEADWYLRIVLVIFRNFLIMSIQKFVLCFAALSVECNAEDISFLSCITIISPTLNIFTRKGQRGKNELASRL